MPNVSPRHRELAILASGAVHKCVYELYAHARVALALPSHPFTRSQVVAAVAGLTPADLSKEEESVWEFCSEVAGSKGPMRSAGQRGYDEAERLLGRQQLLELVHVVGLYSYVALLLNVGDVQVPTGEGALPSEDWNASPESKEQVKTR